MVVIRLKPMGRTHRKFYRICAMDKRVPVDGRALEELGWYDPVAQDDRQVALKEDRLAHWIAKGAQPSDTVKGLIRKHAVDAALKGRYAPKA